MSIPFDLTTADIATPEVVVDLDVLTRNVERMAAAVAANGLQLRPHAKTHKIGEIATLQLAHGAVGLTVATIGEAEVFVEAGVADVFIAYPLWVGPSKAARLRRLTTRAALSLAVDSAGAAEAMGAALGAAAGAVEVLVEIDSGHHRSGVEPDQAVEVARAAARAGLRVIGVFTFPGHSYGPGMPVPAAADERRTLGEAADHLSTDGFAITRRSGGSTPSAALAHAPELTEVRPGVYVFNDAQQLELGRCQRDEIALTVAATVVSGHEGSSTTPRRIVLDSGSKVLGADRAAWATGYGRLLDHLDARITALSEHHATVVWPEDEPLPPLGTRLRVVPNHVCIAINLVDDVAVVSDGRLVDRWRVAARGKNR